MSENPGAGAVRSEKLERFGRALRDTLAAHGVSQNEFAHRLGVSSSALTNWAGGSREPRPDVVFHMEHQLGLRPGTLSRILGFCPCDNTRPDSVEAAILDADYLPDVGRRTLLGLHQSLVVAYGVER